VISIFLTVSQWSIPILLILILIAGYHKKVRMYEVFIQGAMEGIKTTIKLTPYILAIFVAIGIFRASGALQFVVYIFSPILKMFQIPPDLLTLGILKPLSGSASLGITAELLNKHGPDSPIGITASIAQSSSETTFYVLSLYLGSVNIKDGRHILVMGLIGEFTAFLLALAAGSLIAKLNF
jgi:spore maturation protein B